MSKEEGSPNWPGMAGGEFLLRLAVDAMVMTMNRLTSPDVGARDDVGGTDGTTVQMMPNVLGAGEGMWELGRA